MNTPQGLETLFLAALNVCSPGGLACSLLEHVTGAVALILQLYGLSHPQDKRLREMSAIAALVFALNHFSLGAVGAAGVNVLLAIRVQASIYLERSAPIPKFFWFCAFTAGTTAAMLLPGITPLALLLGASAVWIGYAYFYQSGISLRVSLGINKLLWIANAIAYDSVWQFALAALGGAASFVGAWRVYQAQAASGSSATATSSDRATVS